MWLVEHEDGSLTQHHEEPGTAGIDAGVRVIEVEREIDFAVEAWDWSEGAIVSRFTPEQARDMQWERAKAYRDEDRYFRTLPVIDVIPGETIMVQCDGKSRLKVADLAQAATWATMRGEELEITFTDGANTPFTVDAEQTIAIKAAVTLNDALCHLASQAIRAQLDAALAASATAAEIFAIDVTANYPGA